MIYIGIRMGVELHVSRVDSWVVWTAARKAVEKGELWVVV